MLRRVGLFVALAMMVPSACTRDSAGEASSNTTAADRGATAQERESSPDPQVQNAAAQAEARDLVRKDGTIFAEAELMGTRVSINVWVGEGDALAASQAMTAAMNEMARIEDIASEWRETSDLSRLNRSAGEAVEVPPELIEILARAAEISADTQGLFDVTFYSVGQLWRFTPGSEPPSRAAIDAHLPSVDWRAVELAPGIDGGPGRVSFAKPDMKVGLGAIAKGYAVDRASAVLHQRGLHDHIVEAGGDTQVSGKKDGKPWRVGVQDPHEDAARVGHIVVEAESEAVVTSGNYARYFEYEGVHYTHILDPRTGWPILAERSPKSVTLVAQNATDADAYCTAVSVMEPEAGLAFVEARPQLEAVIIGPDDTLHVSSGLRARFVDERK